MGDVSIQVYQQTSGVCPSKLAKENKGDTKFYQEFVQVKTPMVTAIIEDIKEKLSADRAQGKCEINWAKMNIPEAAIDRKIILEAFGGFKVAPLYEHSTGRDYSGGTDYYRTEVGWVFVF